MSVNFEALGNRVLYVATDFPLEKLRVAVGIRAQFLNISGAEVTPG